jgi:hypothetical protein
MVSFGSNPTIKVEIPNGLTPPDWVYLCTSALPSSRLIQLTDLLNPSNVLGDVLDTDRILDRQSMGLTFDSSFINKDSTISR